MNKKNNDLRSIWDVKKYDIKEIRERRNQIPGLMTEEQKKEMEERWKTTSRKPRK